MKIWNDLEASLLKESGRKTDHTGVLKEHVAQQGLEKGPTKG